MKHMQYEGKAVIVNLPAPIFLHVVVFVHYRYYVEKALLTGQEQAAWVKRPATGGAKWDACGL
jgi:hypothetical protein